MGYDAWAAECIPTFVRYQCLFCIATGINGTVRFEGLSPGYYTIRIVAETSDGEKATLRVRARVLKGPGYCTVNLINQQWTLDENVLSVWFEGHPKQDQFECKVNKNLSDCHGKNNVN